MSVRVSPWTLLAAYDHGHLDLGIEHFLEPGFELLALLTTGRIFQNRFVHGLWYMKDAIEHRFLLRQFPEAVAYVRTPEPLCAP